MAREGRGLFPLALLSGRQRLQLLVGGKKRSAANLRRLFTSNIVGMNIADIHGRILSANERFLEMIGYEHDDLPLYWHELTPPEWRAIDDAKTEEVLREGAGDFWEKEFLHKDGSRVPVQIAVTLMHGSRERCVALVVDLTAIKEAEEQSQQHERELRDLVAALATAEERERRRIGSGLHDEIGQVLAIAKAKVGQLRDVAAEDETAALGASLERLLDRSILSIRELTFELASPVLYELGLAAALRDLGERTERLEGIAFRFTSGGSGEVPLGDSAAMLFRMVRELVRNVVRHATATHLDVKLELTANRVGIVVEDDGAGFEVSSLEDGFSSEGGFGLFSVRRLVEELGGSLEIRSTPGAGTRVEIRVPAAQHV